MPPVLTPMPARALALLLLAALLAACAERKPQPPPEPALVLQPASFADLPGWDGDDPTAALGAFRTSCGPLLRLDPAKSMGGATGVAGKVGDWQPACRAAAAAALDPASARAFFAATFQPYRATNRGDPDGLFTGYYEPLLQGSRTAGGAYRHPLLKRPGDLVSVDLGQFDPELQGRRIAGRVDQGKLVPYPDRAAIENGALAGRQLELLWVDDPVEKFFMEIQGSGQIRLPDGSTLRVGYADQNGRPYRAIGKDLVEQGALPKDQVSMQAIRAWLVAHPDQAPAVMAKNPSYVFFRELPGLATASGPLGAQGVPLTPGRSLAIDRKFLPLGAPAWLDTTAPMAGGGEQPLRRLVVTQDTGGAIRGPVRGDLFWGSGPAAETAAGYMKSKGRLYLLLPRQLTPAS
ncbi:MAG: MltA domain-containing protein [Geminicoccaceae bacterium]